MKKPNAEVMEARVRELIETGKSKGVLTYKEIVELLGDVELDSEQFDRILDTLSGLNIDVVKDEAIPEADPVPDVGRGGDRHLRARGHLHRRPGAHVSEGDRQGAAFDRR